MTIIASVKTRSKVILVRLASWKRDESGATAVEFAMISGAFILLLLGVFEMGRALWITNSLQYAAERASRYALVHSETDESTISDYLGESLRSVGVPTTGMSVTVEEMEYHSDQPGFVSVRVNLPYNPVLLPLGTLLWENASLSAISQRSLMEDE
ncbi:MAG: pilus assembly protein [Alphaproteobacteria bacterium]|nr:pilus assembly protein [Alphaproteobacteria bacterium]